MAEIKRFFDTGAFVTIETEGSGAGTSAAYAGDLARALDAVLGLLSSRIKAAEEAERPSEISVTFGLGALTSGGFAIRSQAEAANFVVTASWRNDDGSSPIQGLLPPVTA